VIGFWERGRFCVAPADSCSFQSHQKRKAGFSEQDVYLTLRDAWGCCKMVAHSLWCASDMVFGKRWDELEDDCMYINVQDPVATYWGAVMMAVSQYL
jgi:hypothetical protein